MDTHTDPNGNSRGALRIALVMLVASFTVAGFAAWSAEGLLPVAAAGASCVLAAWRPANPT